VDLSQIIISHPEVTSFKDLLVVIGQYGAKGVILLNFDLKPDFPDTPRNWEWEIENAFTWGGR